MEIHPGPSSVIVARISDRSQFGTRDNRRRLPARRELAELSEVLLHGRRFRSALHLVPRVPTQSESFLYVSTVLDMSRDDHSL